MERTNMNPQIDIFNNTRTIPTACIPKGVLLFDNFNGYNPLVTLSHQPTVKLWQTTMMFILQGYAKFRVNGDEVHMRAGQFLTTFPDSTFSFIEASENIRYMMYVIYPDMLIKTFDDLHVNYNITTISGKYYVKSLVEEDLKYYFTLFLELKEELIQRDHEIKANFARCFLDVLFATNSELFTVKQEVIGDTSSRQYDVYKKFLIDLNKHAEKERSVNFYAELQDISAKYLSFVCIQYSGKNASSWIDEYVATKAKALISVHHLGTQELCQALNFTSTSSFIRYFKRVTGMSPKEYANSLKK